MQRRKRKRKEGSGQNKQTCRHNKTSVREQKEEPNPYYHIHLMFYGLKLYTIRWSLMTMCIYKHPSQLSHHILTTINTISIYHSW